MELDVILGSYNVLCQFVCVMLIIRTEGNIFNPEPNKMTVGDDRPLQY